MPRSFREAPVAENPPSLQLQFDEQTSQGHYANLAMLSATDSEFILDFVFVPPHTLKAKVGSRVILSPSHAKRLAQMLVENINRYEAVYGPIRMPVPPPPVAPGNAH